MNFISASISGRCLSRRFGTLFQGAGWGGRWKVEGVPDGIDEINEGSGLGRRKNIGWAKAKFETGC